MAGSGGGITLLDVREFNRKIFNAMGAVDRTATSPAFFASYIRKAVAKTNDEEVKHAAELMLSLASTKTSTGMAATTTQV